MFAYVIHTVNLARCIMYSYVIHLGCILLKLYTCTHSMAIYVLFVCFYSLFVCISPDISKASHVTRVFCFFLAIKVSKSHFVDEIIDLDLQTHRIVTSGLYSKFGSSFGVITKNCDPEVRAFGSFSLPHTFSTSAANAFRSFFESIP